MSVLGDVLSSLQAMSQWQLLLAFVAGAAYVLAQGGLVGAKGRRIAWLITIAAAIGFGVLATEWMHAAMLITFAIAGLGVFVASAWGLSRAIGFSRVQEDPPELLDFAEGGESFVSDFASTHAQVHAASTFAPSSRGGHTVPAPLS